MKILHRPLHILALCLTLATLSLIFNGGLFQLHRMHRDQGILRDQIVASKMQIVELDKQLKMAKDPVFIEHQAMENYDMVEENDLVFVFPEE